MRRVLIVFLLAALGTSTALADDRVRPAIVGGDEASREYPFFTAVIVEEGGDSFVCGGSLIAPKKVLTAAHCVVGDEPRDVRLGFGNSGLESPRRVVAITVHPRYATRTVKRDVAVLTLEAAVTDRDPIATAGSEATPPGTLARVIGRGVTGERADLSEVLREVDIPVRSDRACDTRLGGLFFSRVMLCVGRDAGGQDTCSGDSGGPIFTTGEQFTQVGVTSLGVGCGRRRLPGIYTELSSPSVRSFVTGALAAG